MTNEDGRSKGFKDIFFIGKLNPTEVAPSPLEKNCSKLYNNR